jgi:preprotein translocase subunit SecA
MRRIEKEVMLFTLDSHWKEHLAAMDYLRQGIHLRGYAQKNPKQEYKREAFERFSAMLDAIKLEVVQILCRLQLQAPPGIPENIPDPSEFEFKHEAFEGLESGVSADAAETAVVEEKKPFVRPDRKVGRNDPCPCGSGKKYKHCHGKLN